MPRLIERARAAVRDWLNAPTAAEQGKLDAAFAWLKARVKEGDATKAEQMHFHEMLKARGIQTRRVRLAYSTKFITCICGKDRDECECLDDAVNRLSSAA